MKNLKEQMKKTAQKAKEVDKTISSSKSPKSQSAPPLPNFTKIASDTFGMVSEVFEKIRNSDGNLDTGSMINELKGRIQNQRKKLKPYLDQSKN